MRYTKTEKCHLELSIAELAEMLNNLDAQRTLNAADYTIPLNSVEVYLNVTAKLITLVWENVSD